MTPAPASDVAVLHLLAPAPFGGLERVVEALAAGRASRGRRTGVAALGIGAVEDHPLLRRLRAAGVDVAPVAAAPRAYFRQVAAVRDRLAEGRYGVLHSHGYHADLVARFVGSVRRVSTFHGFTGGDLKNRLYEWAERRAVRSFDRVIVVSDPLADALAAAGVPRPRIEVIRNALPPEGDVLDRREARQALGLSAEDQWVGWIGRLTDEKGPDLFVDAIAGLPAGPRAVVIGDGPLRASLEGRARQSGLSDRIHWAGSVPAAFRFLAALDLLVLSSRTEGTPMVLLEAMRAGVPIVATGVGGVPAVMTGAEGLVVPPQADAISGAIREVLADPAAARARAAEAAIRFRREFDFDRWLDRYEGVYRQLGDGQ